MARYPKDEFDDIPPMQRKGAHRRTGGTRSQAGAIALISVLAIAALLLVLGAVNIIRSSAEDPEQQVAEPAATAEETADPTETAAGDSVEVVEKTASVTVLNASGVGGVAGRFGDAVEDAGWEIAQVGNYSTPDSVSSVHYSDSEFEMEARAIADLLGIEDVEESTEFQGDITVVVCSDIADSEPGGGAETPGSATPGAATPGAATEDP
ncbi:hypothetical protein GCM10022261_06360 [Brevibacterium daeguense]|uniref:LytR/CpsA/Psr regulator C-terminal domain-containing protein n=1 Tax=Brevibacterium daeguense TaxID=909936 RepID=A0ABP8EGM4_9MICO|nr:LytR C-terminal domain-containing protein [Brevibacterium daeguense]